PPCPSPPPAGVLALARLLAAERLECWGLPVDPARLIVAELAANAARHGRVPGRGFRLTLTVTACGVLRIEVTDPRGEREPVRGGAVPQPGESEIGRASCRERGGKRAVERT